MGGKGGKHGTGEAPPGAATRRWIVWRSWSHPERSGRSPSVAIDQATRAQKRLGARASRSCRKSLTDAMPNERRSSLKRSQVVLHAGEFGACGYRRLLDLWRFIAIMRASENQLALGSAGARRARFPSSKSVDPEEKFSASPTRKLPSSS